MLSRGPRSAVVTFTSIAVVVLVYACLAYARRWISDDGLIAVRTVRELLAGHGPTFNAFERAEANTSTLWTYILALGAVLSRQDVSSVAVALGGVLAVLGVAIAMDGSRRWHRARGSTAPLVPFGVLVVIGAFPFWDFATSGLESGLVACWLASVWWLLVHLLERPRWRVQLATVVVFGLGPLVRPDFALVTAVMFVAQVALAWPLSRRAIVALAAAGAALPVAYEIFRAGYYGTLVPLPALAKGASGSAWVRGFDYIRDFAQPHLVLVPIGLAILLGIVARKHVSLARRDRFVLAAPVIAGALLIGFVARVGGDFMHGRMCLPPLFLAMMPVALVPWQHVSRRFVIAMAVWTIAVAIWRGDGKRHTLARMVEDERYGYALWTKDDHPDEAAYRNAEHSPLEAIDRAHDAKQRRLLSEGGVDVPMSATIPGSIVLAVGRLGAGGVVTPLDAIVADTLGLANPLGARITATQPGITGHEKSLPWPWLYADFGDPSGDPGPQRLAIAAARHAMTCGALRELLESVREPLTWSRFWANLTGSVRRTRLVIPSDPFEADAAFCGDTALAKPTASSSYEQEGWSVANAVDSRLDSTAASMGFASMGGEPQWIELDTVRPRAVSHVTLYPRTDGPSAGMGFPIDFQIQVWDGARWIDRVTKVGYENPGATPQDFTWSPPDVTARVRVVATKLPHVDLAGARLQLAELVVR
ncbi:MAG TPA: discoidin domain-containing protein [Kofleriaceae bacterium]